MTYLGGSAWGLVISQQEYATARSCESAREAFVEMVSEMNKTNLSSGRSGREIVKRPAPASSHMTQAICCRAAIAYASATGRVVKMVET